MIVVRKLLDYVFTQRELKILDDIMPENSKRKDEEERIMKDDFDDLEVRNTYTFQSLLANAFGYQSRVSVQYLKHQMPSIVLYCQLESSNYWCPCLVSKGLDSCKCQQQGGRGRV